MKKSALILAGYGIFLILIGLVGYLSNPEKAKTALMSGGTFGLLNIGLSVLVQRGWSKARTVALVVAAFLAAVFTWRSIVTWMKFAEGAEEKLMAGALITSMLVATVGVGVYLIATRRSAN